MINTEFMRNNILTFGLELISERAILELLDHLEAVEKECDALRAKITAMEQQQPVGKFVQHPSNGLWEQDGYGDNPEASPLYALPGAQGETK